jgi:hypothetical protein
MKRMVLTGMLALTALALAADSGCADVIIRGPFGGMIVIGSGADVRIGPGVYVGPRQPAYPPPMAKEPPIVSTPKPVIRPDEGEPLPPPKKIDGGVSTAPVPVPTPVAPQDFVKDFKAVPGHYEVLFLHPVNNQAVNVPFDLPEGNPKVSYKGRVLLFDYGRHEVEIRFKLGGRVVVTQR